MKTLNASVFAGETQKAGAVLFDQLFGVETLLSVINTTLRLNFNKESDDHLIRLSHFEKMRANSVRMKAVFMMKEINFTTAVELIRQTIEAALKVKPLITELVERFSQYEEALCAGRNHEYAREVLLPGMFERMSSHLKAMSHLFEDFIAAIRIDVMATSQNLLRNFSESERLLTKIIVAVTVLDDLIKEITERVMQRETEARVPRRMRGHTYYDMRPGRVVIREPLRSDGSIFPCLTW